MDENARLWSKLQRLLRRRGRSREDTEDLIQDAFVRLQKYCRVAEVHEREAFLVRTTLNLELDQQRRERYRLFAPEALEDLPLADDGPTPDEVIDIQQRLHQMECALGAVSQRTRDMYWMNRVEGYSYTQIAKKLNISVSAVEKHMTRALASLMAQQAAKGVEK
jgi:RNA polymerase sigma factor (sigma-70 family)